MELSGIPPDRSTPPLTPLWAAPAYSRASPASLRHPIRKQIGLCSGDVSDAGDDPGSEPKNVGEGEGACGRRMRVDTFQLVWSATVPGTCPVLPRRAPRTPLRYCPAPTIAHLLHASPAGLRAHVYMVVDERFLVVP